MHFIYVTKKQAKFTMKTIVLLSGGLDSLACLHHHISNNEEVSALFIDYGQASLTYELRAAKQIAKEFYSIDFKTIKVMNEFKFSDGFILGRNLMFVSLALFTIRIVEPTKISLGIHKGTNYVDCTNEFINKVNKIMDLYSNGRIRVVAPFKDLIKNDIYCYALNEKLPIKDTYSCEKGNLIPCGMCNSCLDMKVFNVCEK